MYKFVKNDKTFKTPEYIRCVVVISDSNMSQSASSEDSISVNVNSGITTNETVWIKEGDTTEDENSITINAE